MSRRSETSAGGVVFRRIEGRTEVALGEQRDRLTGERRTRLPKGKAEPGESPEQTALREVEEETGLRARVVAPLGEVEYVYRERGEPVDKRVLFFLMELLPEAPGPGDGELERVFWSSPADAVGLLSFDTERRVMQRACEQLGL